MLPGMGKIMVTAGSAEGAPVASISLHGACIIILKAWKYATHIGVEMIMGDLRCNGCPFLPTRR